MDDGIPNLIVFILSRPEFFQLVMFVRHQIIGWPTLHKVDNIIASEVFLYGHHGFKHNEQSLFCLSLGFGMQTVVAVMTVVFGVFFAKIVKQHLAPAHRRLCVSGRF